jgi:hypothetical protein
MRSLASVIRVRDCTELSADFVCKNFFSPRPWILNCHYPYHYNFSCQITVYERTVIYVLWEFLPTGAVPVQDHDRGLWPRDLVILSHIPLCETRVHLSMVWKEYTLDHLSLSSQG